MPGPARVPKDLWRGDDTPPLVWGFGTADAPGIPEGAQFRLEIAWRWLEPALGLAGGLPPGTITAASPDDGLVVDLAAGTVTWVYTTAQSAGIPLGSHARYQLRCLYEGTTQTWTWGELTPRGVA